MKTSFGIRLCAGLAAFVLLSCFPVLAGGLPVLHTKTDSYKNVTLISRTATHAFVEHSRGVATIKLVDLDAEALKGLGITDSDSTVTILPSGGRQVAPPENSTVQAEDGAARGGSLGEWAQSFTERLKTSSASPPTGRVLYIALGIVAVVFLFFSYTAMLICQKAGTEPGILVWVPVFQMIPLLRAAGMSGWWFLALFVPVVGLVVQIIWIFRLAKARGKGVLTAICLLLPFTSLFAWLYLAFSDAGGTASSEDAPPTKSVQTEPLPA